VIIQDEEELTIGAFIRINEDMSLPLGGLQVSGYLCYCCFLRRLG